MTLSTVVFALIGKVLAFVVLGPIIILLLVGYIIAGKLRGR